MAECSDQAFAAFYAATSRPLWTYVYHVTGNAADADDIMQDAFCRVLRADIGALSEEERRRYIFRVAGNLVADRWRKERRARSLWWGIRLVPAAMRATVSEDEALDKVAQTFAALKPRERALLWLAYVEEQSHDQIAGALGIERVSVKVLLFRARARLRNLLNAQSAPQR